MKQDFEISRERASIHYAFARWHARWRGHNKQIPPEETRIVCQLGLWWINLIARGGSHREEWPYDRFTLTVIAAWIIQVV